MTGSGPPGRDPFSRYRDLMAAVGFRPSTTRGQNFLLDPSLHRWIAEQAGPSSSDTVIEIGVGLGFLTRELAARAGKVLAVEIEPRLLEIAKSEVPDSGNLEWLEGDALGGAGRTLTSRIGEVAKECTGRLLVVANLPYSVSGPMLAELAQLVRLPDRIVVLVQKELGQRLSGNCGSSTYGGLSGLLQSMFTTRSLRDVSPSVFRPRPKVWSSVVALDLRADISKELQLATRRRRFALFLRTLFGQRRKALRSTYRLAADAMGRPGAALDESWACKRAQELTPDELVGLWVGCETNSG